MNTTFLNHFLWAAIMLLVAGFTSDAQAQRFGPQQMSTKYSGQSGAMSLTIPGWVLRMGLRSSDEGLRDALRGVRQVRLLVVDKNNVEVDSRHVRKLQNTLQNRRHEPLITVRTENDDVRIYVRERRSKIRELTILVNTDDELVMVHLSGAIQLSKVDQLINNYTGKDNKKRLSLSF